jgi:hypothetical protein
MKAAAFGAYAKVDILLRHRGVQTRKPVLQGQSALQASQAISKWETVALGTGGYLENDCSKWKALQLRHKGRNQLDCNVQVVTVSLFGCFRHLLGWTLVQSWTPQDQEQAHRRYLPLCDVL